MNQPTFALVGYLNQVNEPGVILALWKCLTATNPKMPHQYFVRHDAVPQTKIPLASPIPLADRQLVHLQGYKNPFYVNLYSSDDILQQSSCN